MEFDKTMNFKVEKEKNTRIKEVLKEVYDALTEKGYNPINQLVGYILSGDPTYITSYKIARNKRTLEYNDSNQRRICNSRKRPATSWPWRIFGNSPKRTT